MIFSSNQLCALTDLAVLHIQGADARAFMQAQLTNAVDNLTAEQAVLAGYCQAKGRLQATMVVWVDPDNTQNLYALLHRSIAETVRKRLSMFVLRAKVELVESNLNVYGVMNSPTESFHLPSSHYSVIPHEQGLLINAPSSNQQTRAWLISNSENKHSAELSAQDWYAADCYAGLPWIQAESYETFLPQDINLDIIGGVSFKKGCFPGQEVVARLHYRSTAKRRGALGAIASPNALEVSIGTDVFSQDNPDRPYGRIINTAYDQQQQKQVLLFEALIDGLTEQQLFIKAETNLIIDLLALPYDWHIDKY